MALSAPSTLAAAASTSPSNPHSTASISPTANTPGLIIVNASRNPATTVSVAAGSGLDLGTITAIDDYTYGSIASPTRRIYAWWFTGSASPGSGTVDISFGATPNGAAWIVLHVAGMDTTSPIVSSGKNRSDSATSLSVTVDDASGTLTWDGTFGFFANGDAANSITIGGSFTNIGQVTCASSNSFRLRGEYALSKLTTVDASQSALPYAGIAFGVKAATAGGGAGKLASIHLRTLMGV